jgi:hypothetical protein
VRVACAATATGQEELGKLHETQSEEAEKRDTDSDMKESDQEGDGPIGAEERAADVAAAVARLQIDEEQRRVQQAADTEEAAGPDELSIRV